MEKNLENIKLEGKKFPWQFILMVGSLGGGAILMVLKAFNII